MAFIQAKGVGKSEWDPNRLLNCVTEPETACISINGNKLRKVPGSGEYFYVQLGHQFKSKLLPLLEKRKWRVVFLEDRNKFYSFTTAVRMPQSACG